MAQIVKNTAFKDPDIAAFRVRESIQSVGNDLTEGAVRYMLIAAMGLCEDTLKTFDHYVSHPDADGIEYLALDGRRAIKQIQALLGVMADVERLTD